MINVPMVTTIRAYDSIEVSVTAPGKKDYFRREHSGLLIRICTSKGSIIVDAVPSAGTMGTRGQSTEDISLMFDEGQDIKELVAAFKFIADSIETLCDKGSNTE